MSYFAKSYQDSLDRFQSYLERFRVISPRSSLTVYPVDGEYALHCLHLPARKGAAKRTLIWQSGQHGVEGYFGDAALNQFIETRLGMVDFDETEFYIIHCINPYGMDKIHRNNRNNVDLNRNFFIDPKVPIENQSFKKLKQIIDPVKFHCLFPFLIKSIYAIVKLGSTTFEQASSAGQSDSSTAIYYSGKKYEKETQHIISFYEKVIQNSKELTLLDFHTGYGKRGELLLINSVFEKKSASALKKAYHYNHIISCDGEQMYPIMGDVIDFSYYLVEQLNSKLDYYGVCLEAGTSSQTVFGLLNTVRLFINESFIRHHPNFIGQRRFKKLRKKYKEHFYPSSLKWQKTVLKHAENAVDGILSARGYW